MSIKHDRCQAWETEITRLREELRRSRKVIVTLVDSNVELVKHLKYLEPKVEVDVLLRGLESLKEEFSNE